MDQLAITIPRSLFRPMLFRSGSMGREREGVGGGRFIDLRGNRSIIRMLPVRGAYGRY